MPARSGRHFLQIPGPTNIPDRILRAMDAPVIDHRGPEFPVLTHEILAGMKRVFKTEADVVLYPASGTGGWEAALVNTLSPGDKVLMCETGHFAAQWHQVARNLGLEAQRLATDWRHPVDPHQIESILAEDRSHAIKALTVVHNETATAIVSDIAALRKAIDNASHPALLIVDAVSSLAAAEYRHDEWGVDITIAGSQKGLMLPPGLAMHAISAKALAASKSARLPRAYWRWEQMLDANRSGYFPYTPATNLLYGLREALRMLQEEGLERVFARHLRLAQATRRAVGGWGLELCCLDPGAYSNTLTAIMVPEGHDADALRRLILDRFNMSLGTGLGQVKGRVFRIGHLGDFNDLMLAGTLCGVEMGLTAAGVPHSAGGVAAALEFLAQPGTN